MIDNIDENKIDKVLDLDQEKCFPIGGPIAFLESPIYDFDGAAIEFDDPVPVIDDGGKTIGYALISYADNGKALHADVELTYSNPERLSIQTGDDPYYLQIVGAMSVGQNYGSTVVGNVLDLYGSKVHVYWVEIDSLILTRKRPLDGRIEKVREV
jgi:hypothetical protein